MSGNILSQLEESQSRNRSWDGMIGWQNAGVTLGCCGNIVVKKATQYWGLRNKVGKGVIQFLMFVVNSGDHIIWGKRMQYDNFISS